MGDAVVDALRAQLVAVARPNSIDLAQTLKQVTILFLVVDSTARSRHSIAVFGANEAREDDADRI